MESENPDVVALGFDTGLSYDRMYTDIALADGSGVTSILVLTGEATLDDVKNSVIKPDFIVRSLMDITEAL